MAQNMVNRWHDHLGSCNNHFWDAALAFFHEKTKCSEKFGLTISRSTQISTLKRTALHCTKHSSGLRSHSWYAILSVTLSLPGGNQKIFGSLPYLHGIIATRAVLHQPHSGSPINIRDFATPYAGSPFYPPCDQRHFSIEDLLLLYDHIIPAGRRMPPSPACGHE